MLKPSHIVSTQLQTCTSWSDICSPTHSSSPQCWNNTCMLFFLLISIYLHVIKHHYGFLTSHQQDDASCHGDAGLAQFVGPSTGGALHSHTGHTQACDGHNDANYHQGTSGLKWTWGREERKNIWRMRKVHKDCVGSIREGSGEMAFGDRGSALNLENTA